MFLINPYIYGGESYLVDDYSPVVAYSLQQISSANPNAIRLRRGDNAESDFTATDIADGTALTWSNGGGAESSVVKWYNQGTGGSTYDMVQTVAANQPRLIVSSAIWTRNGLPSIRIDSANSEYLTCANTPFGQVSNSFFAVSSARVTSTTGTILSLSDTSVQSLRIFQDTSSNKYNLAISNTTPTGYRADMSTARTTAAALTLLSSFVDASKGMSAFDNGATGTTNTFTGTWTNDAMQLGRQGGGTPAYLDGSISEFIGLATDEISNRTDIETNINDRYSIY